MNPPESDDNRQLYLTVTEKRQRNGSPESDDIEEILELRLGFAEKRQRTDDHEEDEDVITVVKDFLAEYNPFEEETVMEVMKGLEDEISCNNDNNSIVVSAFPSLPTPISSVSSVVTINGGSESCGVSFSDSSSSLMATSLYVGVKSISAYLMWDRHVLQDWGRRISSVLDHLVLEKTEQNRGAGKGSLSFDIEQGFLSLKMGESGQDDESAAEVECLQNGEKDDDDSGDLDHGCLSLSLSDSTYKTEQKREEKEESTSGCLSLLSDSTYKTEENGEEKEESTSGCLSLLSGSTYKTEENGEEEEEEKSTSGCLSLLSGSTYKTEENGEESSFGCLSLFVNATIKTEQNAQEEEESSSGCLSLLSGSSIKTEEEKEESIDEWIERVLKQIPFDFEFETEV